MPLESDNFGSRLVAQEILSEFRDFCDKRDYTVREMRNELDRSREDIRGEANQYAVLNIEKFIDSYEECPRCKNDLLLDESEDIKYCPSCE